MATNFKLKRSSVANKRPGLTNLELGELALNTYDGYLFTERNGLGITTVTNLTPWYENYGAASIFYSNSVGIGTTNPIYDLDVRGSIGGYNDLRAPHRTDVITYTVTVASKDATHRYNGTGSSNGYKIDGEFSPFLVLTPGRTYKFDQSHSSNSNHAINFYLEADKTTTYSTGVTVNGTAGNSGAYTQIVVGDQTPTVLHYQCVNHGYMGNAVQVNSNVVNSNYPAILRGGLNVSGAETILSSATVSDLTSTRIVYAGTGGSLEDSANLRFTNNTLYALNIDVDGLAELDDVNVSAASTFGGIIDANHQIVGLATNNIIPFLFNAWNDLPSASTYHGAFAHVHARGKGYFAHGGAWYELVNKELDGTIGVGTEVYNIGITSVSTLDVLGVSTFRGNVDVNADIDVDGHTELDNVNVSGIATFANDIHANGNIIGDNATNISGINNISAVDAVFSGNVSIAGTLTKEDVTNIDSVGLVTARTGVHVLSNGIDAVGVITATQGLDAIGIQSGGVNITTGIITAINFTGTGNTVTYDSSTKIVSVSVGGAGGGAGGKFVENNTGIHTLSNVGIGTTNASDKLKVLGDVAFTGALKVSPLGLSGSNGNYLKSVGTGVTWAAFPTARTVGLQTATANQTSFSFNYNVGFLDVYINGVKLTTNEFTATNGTSVVLTEGAFLGDQVQLISFNTTASGGGGGGSGITDVVQDATPQLGGNLDLNSKIINGTGNIDYTGNFKASGIATATTFSGSGASLTNLNASALGSGTVPPTRLSGPYSNAIAGSATVASNVNVIANNTTDETCYPLFADGATGTQQAESDTGLTYNPSTGALTATSFAGSGSDLTGLRAFRNIAVSGQATIDADTVEDTLTLVAGSNMTITTNPASDTITFASSGGGGTANVGITTNLTGSISVTAGSPSNIDSYTYNTNDIVFEYTVFIKNGSNYQSQKVLAMRDGTTVHYNEFAVMHSSSLLATMDVVRVGSAVILRITPETGVSGTTTFIVKREVS